VTMTHYKGIVRAWNRSTEHKTHKIAPEGSCDMEQSLTHLVCLFGADLFCTTSGVDPALHAIDDEGTCERRGVKMVSAFVCGKSSL
jgi:hypothetical protein